MSNEERLEICKAFAYNLQLNKISEVTKIPKDELKNFHADNDPDIEYISAHYCNLEKRNKEE